MGLCQLERLEKERLSAELRKWVQIKRRIS